MKLIVKPVLFFMYMPIDFKSYIVNYVQYTIFKENNWSAGRRRPVCINPPMYFHIFMYFACIVPIYLNNYLYLGSIS